MIHALPSRSSPSPLEPPPAVPHRQGWPWDGVPAEPFSQEALGGQAWPRISIVVPSFNQGRYLEETLRSVLLQGYPDVELLVIDGGSTDETRGVLERYAPWLSYWVCEPDRGQSDAINKGLARATGELVTFIGSDDQYLPGAFFEAARLWLSRPEAGCVTGAFHFMDQDSAIQTEAVLPRIPDRGSLDLALADPRSWRLHQVATFYSLEALDAVGRHVRVDLRYAMDRELLYRVLRRFSAVTSERPLAHFRRHPASKSVAEILPFSREMASLYLEAQGEREPRALSRRRRRFSRYWLAKGQLKLAASSSGMSSLLCLARAARFRPGLVLERGYARQWLSALGLADKP